MYFLFVKLLMKLLVAQINELPNAKCSGHRRNQKTYRTCTHDDPRKPPFFHKDGYDQRPIIHDPIQP
jgi:hypothetical protein